MDGKELWSKNLQTDYGHFGLNWGYASSPLLYDGKLIIEVANPVAAVSLLKSAVS